MRLIIGITLMLLGVGMLSCRLESATNTAVTNPPALTWVRTADGWERPGSWLVTPVRPPQLHPLVVALGQGLTSALALAVFRRDNS